MLFIKWNLIGLELEFFKKNCFIVFSATFEISLCCSCLMLCAFVVSFAPFFIILIMFNTYFSTQKLASFLFFQTIFSNFKYVSSLNRSNVLEVNGTNNNKKCEKTIKIYIFLFNLFFQLRVQFVKYMESSFYVIEVSFICFIYPRLQAIAHRIESMNLKS